MKIVFQLWKIWEMNGREDLMGTYLNRPRAKQEQTLLEKEDTGCFQYHIRPEEVKK